MCFVRKMVSIAFVFATPNVILLAQERPLRVLPAPGSTAQTCLSNRIGCPASLPEISPLPPANNRHSFLRHSVTGGVQGQNGLLREWNLRVAPHSGNLWQKFMFQQCKMHGDVSASETTYCQLAKPS